MSFTVKFYKYAKKQNSTAQPLTATSTNIDCNLKAPCNIMNPTLRIDFDSTANKYPDYNYCYIADFGRRYYFIDSWTTDGKMWIAQLSIDVLGTYKSAIGRQELYILRSTYAANGNKIYNGAILDTSYATTADTPTYRYTSVPNPLVNNTGCYIVGVISDDTNYGAVSYYAMSSADFGILMSYMLSNVDWAAIDATEISKALQKALINPMQYITSCMWLPYDIANSSYGVYKQNFHVGWWAMTGARGYLLRQGVAMGSQLKLRVPQHPQADERGVYLNMSPYSIYTLRFYPFGTITIDSQACAYSGASGYVNLLLDWQIDIITGKGILNISTAGINNMIRTVEAQIGVGVPVASVSADVSKMSLPTVATAGASAIVSSGNVGKAISETAKNLYYGASSAFAKMTSSVASATGNDFLSSAAADVATEQQSKITQSNISSSTMAAIATAEVQGQMGNFSAFNTQSVTLSGRFLPLVEEDYDMIGRPYCHKIRVNALSGYMLAREAELGDVAIPSAEKQMIINYLTSGFFYE